MPAVRDNSWNATTVATGTTLALPMPAYEVGDLLLAIMMADTGTATWTGGTPPSGANWAHANGSPTTNTCQLVCMWKYAVANEPATYTFTGSASESFNGSIISVRDVHASTPFGGTPVINFASQAAAAKFNMQSITTNVANALVIYATANSGVGVPSLLEGPVFGLVGADGLAESLGIGWGFQASAGATSSSVGVSNVATGAGVKLAIQIAPPAGGAAVIPPYCSNDASFYINPINGVTAYNGATAFAATADTGFSTSLGGFTAADATVAAAADAGINSFHSVGRLTSISGSTNLAGAELVIAAANKPATVDGKNILVHVGPSTEGQLQRFSSVASGRGIWFGMRSGSATNYKIWQSYGVELGSLRHQPIVINNQAGNLKASAGTFDPTALLSLGMWVSGTGVTTSIWDFASLWMLDTTTIAGGNATIPLDIAGIVSAAAAGKERKSVIRQGANQAVSYQPLQFGDGGTNPVYLDLNATAFEFPRQYDAASKSVTYNSVDNVAGLTYYAGASDTIKHRNSVISSGSKYHWRIHASSSASAAYDFSGLSIIGAGDVQLRAVTTFSDMAFSSCPTIYTNGALINNCAFSDSKLFVTSPASAANISNSTFTKTTGTDHAIEISGTAANFTLTGLSFTGYASSDGSTGNEAIYVNIASGNITISIAGGGSTPSIRTAGATVTVSNAVSVTVTVKDSKTLAPIQNARVRIITTVGSNLVISGVTDVNGVLTGSTTYVGSAVSGTVRRATAAFGTLYKVYDISGTISGSGLNITALMTSDE
jgi:hypothetical protein